MAVSTTSTFSNRKHSNVDASHRSERPIEGQSQHEDVSSIAHSKTMPQAKKMRTCSSIPSIEYGALHLKRSCDLDDVTTSQSDELSCLKYQYMKHEAPLDPPITVTSLEELDEARIKANTSLRHDVNFERDLYLQPNVCSPGARVRQEQTRKYWDAVLLELKLLQFLARNPETRGLKSTWRWHGIPPERSRIRRIIVAVRELLQVVTISRDEYSLHFQNVLDTDLLMPQIERGTLDLIVLLEWLAKILNAHCAPMRDHEIESWLQHTRKSAGSADLRETVKALRGMFAILEVMRLDIANHTLRLLRPSFIAKNQSYELVHFDTQITQGKFDPEQGRGWYNQQRRRISSDTMIHYQPSIGVPKSLSIFIHAFVHCLFEPSASFALPNTFALDIRRIQALREAIRNTTYTDVCTRVFHILKFSIRRGCPQAALTHAIFDPWPISRIINFDSMPVEYRSSASWALRFENIAAEFIRHTTVPKFHELFFTPTCEWLNKHARDDSEIFRSCTESLRLTITDHVGILVRQHMTASPLELQAALVPERGALPLDSRDRHTAAIEQRIAHIALLHWRVWGPLVYKNISRGFGED